MMTRCAVLGVFVFLLLSTGEPAFAAQDAAPLPDLTYKRLLNDLQIIVGSGAEGGDVMAAGLVLRYGSVFDPADKGGLAYLVSRMIGKGAMDRSAKDIQDELTVLGAKFEVRCDWDGMRFMVYAPGARFERALLLLYQVVGEALFDEAELGKLKAEIMQESVREEDPRQRVRSQFEMALYRGTSYGRPLRGSRASLGNISIGDVRLFYRRFFSPNSAALAVIGPSPAANVLQKAARIWGVWIRKDQVPFTFLPPRNPSSRTIYFEDDPASPAAQFVLGNLWPRRESPEYYAATIAARLLQERMTRALPTSLLTVGADARRMPGIFYVQGQAAADQAPAEIRKILEIVDEFKAAPVTAQDLAAVQKRWIEEFNKANRTSEGLCTTLLDSELYRLGTNYTSSFRDMVMRNDADAVKAAAKEWVFPGGVVVVVRGPAASLKPALEPLGQLQQLAP